MNALVSFLELWRGLKNVSPRWLVREWETAVEVLRHEFFGIALER